MNMLEEKSATTHASANARVLLALLSLQGMGRRTAHRLIAAHGPFDALESLVEKHRSPYTAAQIHKAYEHADEIVERSEQGGIQVLSFVDPEFPKQLKEIEDPPLLLHVKGNLEALTSSAIAIIGTREPTSFGEQSARRIASTVAQRCFIVVSGLARGCDTAAHRGCIDAKGKTVAVLAHGLDKLYPAENKHLAEEIVYTSGCLVSEYEIGQRAFKTNFVDRDRLQSGLSQAVILIETGIAGGSMHTARFAQQQHRILACVKHPPHLAMEDKALGNRKLIDDGKALPLASSEDVDMLMQRLRFPKELTDQPVSVKEPLHDQLSMF